MDNQSVNFLYQVKELDGVILKECFSQKMDLHEGIREFFSTEEDRSFSGLSEMTEKLKEILARVQAEKGYLLSVHEFNQYSKEFDTLEAVDLLFKERGKAITLPKESQSHKFFGRFFNL